MSWIFVTVKMLHWTVENGRTNYESNNKLQLPVLLPLLNHKAIHEIKQPQPT